MIQGINNGGRIEVKGSAAIKAKIGRPAFDHAGLASFKPKPLSRKAEILRDKWANICYALLVQGERFARSVSKKDYGRLMQLLSSAGISYDKVVPKGEHLGGNLTVNLFKGLPSGDLQRVLSGSGDTAAPQPLVISGISA